MAVKELNQTTKETGEWLKLAEQRVELPNGNVVAKYQADADLLVIRFSNGESTYSKDDMDKGVIYNYDRNDQLVSIEVLDLYGVFAEA
jgi:hypothetical protein